MKKLSTTYTPEEYTIEQSQYRLRAQGQFKNHLTYRTSSLPVINLTLAEIICITVSISASVRGAYIKRNSAGISGLVPSERIPIADVPEKA